MQIYSSSEEFLSSFRLELTFFDIIADPYFFDTFDDGIKKVYMMIDQCVTDLIDQIERGML